MLTGTSESVVLRAKSINTSPLPASSLFALSTVNGLAAEKSAPPTNRKLDEAPLDIAQFGIASAVSSGLSKPSLIEPIMFRLPLARKVKVGIRVPLLPSLKRQAEKSQPRSASVVEFSLTDTVKSPLERTSMPGLTFTCALDVCRRLSMVLPFCANDFASLNIVPASSPAPALRSPSSEAPLMVAAE